VAVRDEAAESDVTGDDRPSLAVFDVDGVLADVRHRLHHVEKRPKDWPAFFAAMADDGPLEVGIALARDQAALGHELVYLTGRNESWRRVTLDWMERYGVPTGRLVMRRDHDRRPAREFKPEALRRIARTGRVVAVVDDDEAVVRVLTAAGWPVLHATWMPSDAAEQQTLFDAQEHDGRT
jgi:phosphoglycolate phosphatase-like HAD superfamily hydrolase